MTVATLFGRYFAWHYTTGLADCLRLVANFLWFGYHFFSVPVITRTLFSPWRRLGESYRKGFDPERILETLIVNILMRLFGFLIRIIWLMLAFSVIILIFSLGICVAVFFFLAPVVILGSFIVGFYLLFLA
ncbi:MAG: hypothetical protein AAB415_00590 [Patescibacteria group bacterium]